MTNTSRIKLLSIGLLGLGALVMLNWSGRSPLGLASPAKAAKKIQAGVIRVLNIQGEVRDKGEHILSGLTPDHIYSLSLAVDSPGQFNSQDTLRVTLRDAARAIINKPLHLGDPDVYITFRPTVAGNGKIVLEANSRPASPYRYEIKVLQWKLPPSAEVDFETEPNNTWQEANPIRLGTTVFGTGDDHPYIPLLGQDTKEVLAGGEDWFRFDYTEDKPKLVFFMIELAERDNIPADVLIYRVESGKLKAYEEGMDPVTPPHEVQALSGNKFTTRVLKEKGTYYVRVAANHPFYQLRTSAYDVPPYTDPRQAVRTAVDYIISAGDSWHANTPRKGGLYDRVANVHAETALCIACHPTHFSLRAQLYALQNGYPVRQRQQLQFLTERFYNNPRPFYGHPGARWARIISAPANVLSRLAALLDIYEHEVTNENRPKLFEGIGEYLKLYYKARTKLPPDESNGNTPIVSTYEVAWYSWVVLDELYRRTGDKTYREYCEQLRTLIEGTELKNMLDLCYQTLAFCTIDRARYADRIRQNCEKILSYQRPSGQWAMNFDSDAPEAEFQTGHCLWVLGTAGYHPDDPRVTKAVHYLLNRQQSFGGWFDPLQPYENFRTPFRETQMAALALSVFYKGPLYQEEKASRAVARAAAPMSWGKAFAAPPERLDFTRLDRLLSGLDNIWDPPSQQLLSDVAATTQHEDALVRQAAVTCLGRVGDATAVGALQTALGDDHKMVQRAAAWSLRQLASRKDLGFEAISAALSDKNDRVRWGATRVFATHFSYLTPRVDLVDKLLRLVQDPIATIRMQALKGLWQWWYWNDDENLRSRIEDAFFARLAESEHPWVRRNLQEGLYNIADDNIRYLYNNWVPLMGVKQDREQAIRARLAIERRLAEKAARALTTGNDLQRQGVLSGLSEFHLRDANSYQLSKPSARPDGSLYVRIGNDIETIQFFGESAEILAQALLPLVEAPSVETRRLATKAGFMLREPPMAKTYGSAASSGLRDVVALAGRYGDGHQRLARAVYRRLMDPEKDVRATAKEVYKSLTIDPEKERTEVTALLNELLASPYAEARVAALETIRGAGLALADESRLADAVRKYLLRADAGSLAVALGAVPSFPSLHQDAEVLAGVEKALSSDDVRVLRAAVDLTLKAPKAGQDARIKRKVDQLFATKNSNKRKALLDTVNADHGWLEDRRALSLISDALLDPDAGVIGAALGIVRQETALQKNPAILAALGELRTNPKATPSTRYLADSLYRGQNSSEASRTRPDAIDARILDYTYFTNKVQPILQTHGRDGNACVECHATHAIFKLNPPGPDGKYTEEQLRENYRSALKVVNLLAPEKSLILRKPTSTSESEGLVGSDRISHGGGVRWGTDSPEYRTILEWINGAKLVSTHAPGK